MNLLIFELYKIKGQCRFKNGKLNGKQYKGRIYNISSFIWVKQGDDNALMEVLDKYGPVSVAIDASDPLFVSYSDHIFGNKLEMCNINRIGFIN